MHTSVNSCVGTVVVLALLAVLGPPMISPAQGTVEVEVAALPPYDGTRIEPERPPPRRIPAEAQRA